MSKNSLTKFGPVILVLSLVLNAVFVSCGADAVTQPQNPQGQDAEILAKLVVLTERLDSIQSKIDQHSLAFATRIDELEATFNGGGGGDSVPPVMQAAQIDSILALASWVASDMSSPGWERCGDFQFTGKFELKANSEAMGRAEAFLGIDGWGNGGKVKAFLHNNLKAELGADVDAAFGWTRCVPLVRRDPPPLRPEAGALAARASSADDFDALMTQLSNQLGVNETSVMQAMNGLGDLSGSASAFDFRSLAQSLPLPGGLAAIANDPVGTISSRISDRFAAGRGLLCNNTGNWGSNLSEVLMEACNRLDNPPDFGALFSAVEGFPALQDGFDVMQSRVTTMCGRVNSMGTKSLTIANPLNIGPQPFYGPQRIFPNFTGLVC